MQKVPNKIYVPTGGGLGDIVRCYLRDEPYWGYMQSLKRKYPHIIIKVVSTSHNPEVREFFKYVPFIYDTIELGWMLDGRAVAAAAVPGFTHINSVPGLRGMTHIPPKIYISPEDQQQYDKIVNKGKYVFCHPFGIRAVMPMDEFKFMFDELIDKHGYNVVVIGATHNRVSRQGAVGPHDPGGLLNVIEELDYERPGLFNLVNKSNVRLAMKLAYTADRFLGHCSCYNIVAWIRGIKSFVFSPPDQRGFLQTTRSHAWPLIDNLPWCKNMYSDEWSSPHDAAIQAVEFLS
jgi:hypothetical protein